MDLHDDVPHLVVHVGEGLVPEDTGVVDEDINAAVSINRALHNGIAVRHIGLVSDSLATEFLDLLDDGVWVYEVVHDDLGTQFGEEKSVCATKTSTGASNEHYLALEVEILTGLVRWQLLRLLEQLHEVGGAGGVLWLGEVVDLVPLSEYSTRGQCCVGTVDGAL